MVSFVTTRASRRHNHPVSDQPDHSTMSAASSLAPVSTVASSLAPVSTAASSLAPVCTAASSLAPVSIAASSLDLNSTPPSTTNLWTESSDYRAYLSVINLSSDDEELYAALLASMEYQM